MKLSYQLGVASSAVIALFASGTVAADASVRGSSGAARRLSRLNPDVPLVDLSATGEELIVPVQLGPGEDDRRQRHLKNNGKDYDEGDVQVELRMNVLEYVGPAYKTLLRAYNGALPGPTIRVRPGEKLRLTLVNDLREPTGNLANNEYQHPNQTNIHTHGPHISGEDPGDNIFRKIKEVPGRKPTKAMNVKPKQFHTYYYDIDGNHMPGTFWYHPHLHGSTAIQTSSASGMLIIEDPDHFPDIIKNMPDVQMMIYNLDIGTGDNSGGSGSGGLKRQSAESGDLVSSWTDGGFGFETTDSTFNPYGYSGATFEKNVDVFLPNFQFQPKVTIKAKTWTRFRMALSTTEQNLVLGFESKNKCEMKLLAKDGVYVKVDPVDPVNGDKYGPRPINAIFLSSGSRADVAIKCSPGGDNMIQLARGGEDFDPDLYGSPSITIFSIETEMRTGSDPDLPMYYDIPTPCYLADLRQTTVDGSSTVVYDGRFEPMRVYSGPFIPGVFPMFGAAVPYSNETTPIDETFELGQVRELELFTAGVHPHHQHVNHFQLYDVESITDYGIMSDETKTWYKSGDWHDLFQWPRGFIDDTVPPTPTPLRLITAHVRFPLNSYAGRMTFHCHRLNHEDIGMIAFWQIDGEEGTLVDTSFDPSCLPPASD